MQKDDNINKSSDCIIISLFQKGGLNTSIYLTVTASGGIKRKQKAYYLLGGKK